MTLEKLKNKREKMIYDFILLSNAFISMSKLFLSVCKCWIVSPSNFLIRLAFKCEGSRFSGRTDKIPLATGILTFAVLSTILLKKINLIKDDAFECKFILTYFDVRIGLPLTENATSPE
jgi:hypothetical protein